MSGQSESSRPFSRRALVIGGAVSMIASPALARRFEDSSPRTFTGNEIVDSGHRFFGGVSRGLANLVERATERWGRPNGYVLGQEGSGAFIAGLRYGEGTLYTKTQADQKVFWQGPSLGLDFGGDGARTMMLVYRAQSVNDMERRFVGIDGSAYLVGGFGMTALGADNMLVVPIRSGLGARLGINGGYLKFTSRPTWNPF